MATTVTGPIGATYSAVFDGISATLTRLGGVVGYAETGGAIAPDQKTYVTSGGGVLTMDDLKPGRYTLSLSVPISESTTQTKLWEAAGVIPVDAGDNITLDAFLTANVEPLTPTLVQQAIAARDQAVAAAGEAADSASTATTQAGIATTQAGNAASSAAEANTFATQAELAALAAGAPIVTTLTDPVPADDTVELLKLDAGLQVHEVVTGDWVLRGWLVGPKFEPYTALFADASSTFGPDGTVVEYGAFRAEVDSTLAETQVPHAGGVKLRVLPGPSGLKAEMFGAVATVADDQISNTDLAAANTAALQKAFNAHSEIRVPLVLDGPNYLVNDTLQITAPGNSSERYINITGGGYIKQVAGANLSQMVEVVTTLARNTRLDIGIDGSQDTTAEALFYQGAEEINPTPCVGIELGNPGTPSGATIKIRTRFIDTGLRLGGDFEINSIDIHAWAVRNPVLVWTDGNTNPDEVQCRIFAHRCDTVIDTEVNISKASMVFEVYAEQVFDDAVITRGTAWFTLSGIIRAFKKHGVRSASVNSRIILADPLFVADQTHQTGEFAAVLAEQGDIVGRYRTEGSHYAAWAETGVFQGVQVAGRQMQGTAIIVLGSASVQSQGSTIAVTHGTFNNGLPNASNAVVEYRNSRNDHVTAQGVVNNCSHIARCVSITGDATLEIDYPASGNPSRRRTIEFNGQNLRVIDKGLVVSNIREAVYGGFSFGNVETEQPSPHFFRRGASFNMLRRILRLRPSITGVFTDINVGAELQPRILTDAAVVLTPQLAWLTAPASRYRISQSSTDIVRFELSSSNSGHDPRLLDAAAYILPEMLQRIQTTISGANASVTVDTGQSNVALHQLTLAPRSNDNAANAPVFWASVSGSNVTIHRRTPSVSASWVFLLGRFQPFTSVEDFGTAEITSGNTEVTVNHGAGLVMPSQISIIPTADWGAASKWCVDEIGENTFKIKLDADPEAAVGFAWSVLPRN